ncbi:MAG: YeeE/YedE family protein [Rhodothermaceae bacterium]|nr:YeeE/YedE family protein [Rhodothermaceae bacterium]
MYPRSLYPRRRQSDLDRSAHSPVSEPAECIDTEQVAAPLKARALREGNAPLALLAYGLFGAYLGLVFTKGEVISWFRIQEMFRFDSVHMYGIIGSAVAVAGVSVWLIKRLGLTTVHGEPIRLTPKQWGDSRLPGARYWMGGITFGFGWALLGACPGPLFALLGGGVSVMAVALVSALVGTWAYAALRAHLPH